MLTRKLPHYVQVRTTPPEAVKAAQEEAVRDMVLTSGQRREKLQRQVTGAGLDPARITALGGKPIPQRCPGGPGALKKRLEILKKHAEAQKPAIARLAKETRERADKAMADRKAAMKTRMEAQKAMSEARQAPPAAPGPHGPRGGPVRPGTAPGQAASKPKQAPKPKKKGK